MLMSSGFLNQRAHREFEQIRQPIDSFDKRGAWHNLPRKEVRCRYVDQGQCTLNRADLIFVRFINVLQVKTASYDPFILECVAFMHQQVLSANHNYQMSLSSGASDDSTREYRSSMVQCRNTCLQSLQQLVSRASADLKVAAPDLKFSENTDPLGDVDDSRTMHERLFDE
jgi:hypothetical protein